MIYIYNKAAKKDGKFYKGKQKVCFTADECFEAMLNEMKDGETVFIIEKISDSSFINDMWNSQRQTEAHGKFG